MDTATKRFALIHAKKKYCHIYIKTEGMVAAFKFSFYLQKMCTISTCHTVRNSEPAF